jgi:ATP-dependent exoDNAse (exonuclease V) alpha subunit
MENDKMVGLNSGWTPSTEQVEALEKILEWQRTGRTQVFRVFGYAGVGKTTLIKQIAGDPEEIRVGTFTGKAAQVLRIKGVRQASTIHRMIYRSKLQDEFELREAEEKLKDPALDARERDRLQLLRKKLIVRLKQPEFGLNLDAFSDGVRLVIIDECSMVMREIAEDLLSFGIPVLVFGDPAQLPPVRDELGYFMQDEPDVLMEEIHRQAQDNPILQLAKDIRSKDGPILPHGEYGNSRIIKHMHSAGRWWETHDQLLVGMNHTRITRNREARRGLGFTGVHPNVGERLVCLKNNHQKGLLNGSLWQVAEVDVPVGPFIDLSLTSLDIPGMKVVSRAWEGIFSNPKDFEDKYPTYLRKMPADEFDFGYALTVHKAQGSEWDNVIVEDESAAWRPRRDRAAQHRNWLYTAVTRAAERLTLVRYDQTWVG